MSLKAGNALASLERAVASMGDVVDTQLDAAISALLLRDAALAEEVVRGDDAIDALDVKIEREGLDLIASHALAPEEFRFVAAALRIVTQLERVGDLATNLAERAITLSAEPPLVPFEDLARMTRAVRRMVKLALTAFARRDADAARHVLEADGEVDAIHRAAFDHYEGVMRADPATIDRAVRMLSCSRDLERIGDHAKNVAEDVIYAVEDRVVRHPRVTVGAREAILVSSGERS